MKIPVFIKIEGLTKNTYHLVRLDRIINILPYCTGSTKGMSTVCFEKATAEGMQAFELYSSETVEEIHETITYKIDSLDHEKKCK